MRSAGTLEITHYTREQLADQLGITVGHLRALASQLRTVLDPSEFDFQPNDGMISANAADKIIRYRELSRTKTRDRALREIQIKGL